MKKVNWPILTAAMLCAVFFANACNANATTVSSTSSAAISASVCLTTAGSATVNIMNNAFQPQMMKARVGTTVTFNNKMGPLTLIGNSGFMMGDLRRDDDANRGNLSVHIQFSRRLRDFRGGPKLCMYDHGYRIALVNAD